MRSILVPAIPRLAGSLAIGVIGGLLFGVLSDHGGRGVLVGIAITGTAFVVAG
ncbi:UNVERIFIED_CONTAM: hypothetical protein DES50_101173 [Williamsia faeni]